MSQRPSTESTSIASPELSEKGDPSSTRHNSSEALDVSSVLGEAEKNTPKDADHSSTSNVSNSTLDDPYQVTLDASEHPQSGLSTFRKWLAVVIISTSALCVACASSIAAFTEDAVAKEFHVPHEVAILSISLFVEGVGIGPLFVGPLSEVYGRNIIYQVSYTLFFAFSWPVAFAPNIAVYLIFRFFTGLCGAAFLSVAGGSVSDMFTDATVANPMAFYTISPFIGPVLGPLISGFINQNLNWRWTWRIALIWVFAQWIALLLFVPETYVPVLLKRKAQRVRKSTGNTKYYAPLEKVNSSIFGKILVSCYRPFQLILYDRMALLLDVWNALILGILYLTFQAFPIVFERGHGFNMQETGLSFLGIGLGMLIAIFTQPFWNRRFARQSLIYDGNPPPEARLIMGQVGAILVPISLYWLAFTTYSHVHWIAPIIASVPFGSGIYFVFMSTFTYLVTAYRPIAASAMASNSSMRSMFAAVFPLFAGAMYNRLGTVGATALLAGLTTIMAPLPFIFYKIGYRLRQQSRFAVH
ncbi:hypothetical protein PC9H_011849 [Pleurotus ostreatus]|uniref:Major facilitator superfamily (MFS) profile domain-containing protein n=1 Tax=Pleurotus ostreatus TaxID=5322 RepID=A0A8H6ZPA1_PLEOS|nr:uncharacterized protein PC9H_011849 [Pleurotus ostreatus]KAF7421327.1 hypothetical protein PC9H_011849 [Pleurotus ostreatus]